MCLLFYHQRVAFQQSVFNRALPVTAVHRQIGSPKPHALFAPEYSLWNKSGRISLEKSDPG
jgi:hypothetical protein